MQNRCWEAAALGRVIQDGQQARLGEQCGRSVRCHSGVPSQVRLLGRRQLSTDLRRLACVIDAHRRQFLRPLQEPHPRTTPQLGVRSYDAPIGVLRYRQKLAWPRP